MRREVQLYINSSDFGEDIVYERLDLFEAQTITVTNSLQDIKDIAKVFTDYSQEFNIPASQNNNRIFKHYYNFDIDGGYDARVKREALIKINGQDYREGFISLNSVSLQKQIPFAYKVVFYGKTVNLKRLIGDDELDELANYPNAYLSQFDFTYTNANVISGFRHGFTLDTSTGNLTVGSTNNDGGDICFPFISARSHYYYDSSSNNAPVLKVDTPSRNLYEYDSNNPDSTGLDLLDLKPAIRFYHIILAIEEKYGLQFSRLDSADFFHTSNDAFYKLYLWLHREKGNIENQIEESVFTIPLSDYDFNSSASGSFSDVRSGANNESLVTTVTETTVERTTISYRYIVTITTTGGGKWGLEMIDSETGDNLAPTTSSEIIDGGFTNTRTFIISSDQPSRTFTPILKIKTRGGITSFVIDSLQIEVSEEEEEFGSGGLSQAGYSVYYTYNNSQSNSISSGLEIAANMPKMKVLDFLTSIFKMFNLTAFYDDRRILLDGTDNPRFGMIRVMTIDRFYSEGVYYDIDKFLYTDKHNVKKANLFSQIDFSYQEASTFAIVNSNEITNDEFGNEKLTHRSADINNPIAFDGGEYNVKVGFEHMMFERMTDQSVGNQINTVWGWMVNKDENPVLGKPLAIYTLPRNLGGYDIPINDGSSSGVNVPTYIRPSNSIWYISQNNPQQSLHFGEELDEWFGLANPESLFKNYWYNYIVPIYSEKSRLSTFQAILPIDIVINLKLNDRLVFGGRSYKINTIKVNINTGKADLELINETNQSLFESGIIVYDRDDIQNNTGSGSGGDSGSGSSSYYYYQGDGIGVSNLYN